MRSQPNNPRPKTTTEWIVWLFAEDHCAWANRYVYWLKSPLGVLGLSAVASLLLGLFVAPQGYILLAAILSVIATGLIWPKLGMRGLACEIAFPSPQAREGQPSPVEVRIINRWPFPVWGLVIEEGFFDVAPEEDSSAVGLARIGGWSCTTFRWDFTPEQRGRYPKATPSLATAFPFGLWKAKKEVQVEGSVLAWPKTFWLPPYPLRDGAQAWSGEPSDAYAGSEGERTGVREHRFGDSLRLVNWAKTARYDRLIVNERQGAALKTASVSVDTDPRSHTGIGRDASLEWAIRIAASVAESLFAQGVRVEVQLGDEANLFNASRADNARLMNWLAEYDSAEYETAGAARGRRLPRTEAPTRLRIGTSRSESNSGEATILLDVDAFASAVGQRLPTTADAGWIVVDDPAKVADQVLRGWRGESREVARGS